MKLSGSDARRPGLRRSCATSPGSSPRHTPATRPACRCRRRGAPNRGTAMASSCPRRSRPMAPPPPWRFGTRPGTVWSTGEMVVEVKMAGQPLMALAGLSQRRTVFDLTSWGWTVDEIPSTPWASRSRPIAVVRPRSTWVTAGGERPLRLPLAPGRRAAFCSVPLDDALLQRCCAKDQGSTS